ncbi:MAG TPA: hypothetical protein P5279_02400 [Anaerohalosphaeraceae bacterium]|jgi:hypothetical protein|nr:hypothetical protein [Anaerohalosphaeraceae bacterium]HRT49320.1 hypothetical protein [Anaerohalosphaeraceae bacterium]HRT85951.1 hypothetical protein [Anaerohalosphaeraceae bacterium]
MEKAREVWLAVLAALICVLSTGPAGLAAPIGTSFTYQGRLYDGGTPAAGPHDFTFELYDDAAAGTQRGTTIHLDDVELVGGYFTVSLDFGNVFQGSQLWLQISVRPGDSSGFYTTLSPRQRISAVPFAQRALNDADTLGSLQCAPGSIPKWINGRWTCAADDTGTPAPRPAAIEPGDWKVIIRARRESQLQAVIRSAAEGATFDGSLIYLGDDSNEKRRIDFFDAVPVRYETLQYDVAQTTYLEEILYFKVGRLKLTTAGLTSSTQKKLFSNHFIFRLNGEPVANTHIVEPGVIMFNHGDAKLLEELPAMPKFPANVRALGFTVDLPYEVDPPDNGWKSISGGGLECVMEDHRIIGYRFGDVLLQGDLSPYRQRKDLVVWINDWVQGDGRPIDGLVTLYSQTGDPLMTVYYEEAVPVLYRPPAVNSGVQEILREELTFRPYRVQ